MIEVREEQPSKAKKPILVTESGITIETRDSQPKNARSPILVTEEGITLFLHPATSVFVFRSIMQLFSLPVYFVVVIHGNRGKRIATGESPHTYTRD